MVNGYVPMQQEQRVSLNLRIDSSKYSVLEMRRRVGVGSFQTERNRSDVYNEYLGLGIQMDDLRQRMGDQDFFSLLKVLMHLDVRKLNLEYMQKLLSKK